MDTSCCKFPVSVIYVSLSKIMKIGWHWQNYCNNTKGDVFIGPFCSSYCLILHCRHCRRDQFSLQNSEKYAISTLIFFGNFFLGHSPQIPILGRGYGAPSQTPPSGASLGTSLHRRVCSPKNYLNYTMVEIVRAEGIHVKFNLLA